MSRAALSDLHKFLKNYEGSEVLPFLQAKKLGCHSFMDAAEDKGSGTKHSLLLTVEAVSKVSSFARFPKLQFPKGNAVKAR